MTKKGGKKRKKSSESDSSGAGKANKGNKGQRKVQTNKKQCSNTPDTGKNAGKNANNKTDYSETPIECKKTNYTTDSCKSKNPMQNSSYVSLLMAEDSACLTPNYNQAHYSMSANGMYPQTPVLASAPCMLFPGAQQGLNMNMQQVQSPPGMLSQATNGCNMAVGMTSTPVPPKTNETQGNVSNAELMQFISSKFDEVHKRLAGLETLENKVKEVDIKISKLWTDLDKRVTQNAASIINVETKVDSTNFDMGKAVEEVNKLKEANDQLKESINELHAKTMINNLIIGGIKEQVGESSAQTEENVRQFLHENLKLSTDSVSAIKIEKSHRIGRPGARPRGILVTFADRKDKDNIKSCRAHLKDTGFYMHDQYPREVVQHRKKLLPLMKKAKEDGKDAFIRFNKLIIEGNEYTGGKYGPLP